MRRIKIAARDIKAGDLIFIQAAGCSPQSVGTATEDARTERGLIKFRIEHSEVYSTERTHFPATKILVERM